MKTKQIEKIAVIAGGISSERKVSLTSSRYVIETLSKMGYEVVHIDPDHNLANILQKEQPDLVFNCMHGLHGEDGCIAGMLEVMGIPYTHSGVLASALAMDKYRTALLVHSIGVQCPKHQIYDLTDIMDIYRRGKHPMDVAYVLKPINNGSSIGVRIVKDLSSAVELKASDYGKQVMVEQYIEGRELTCSVVGDKAIAVTEIVAAKDFYSYDAKYSEGGAQHIIPAQLPQEIYDYCLNVTELVHKTLGCKTVSRADFRYNPAEKGTKGIYFLELNTHPGLTKYSLLPEAARYIGLTDAEFMQILIDGAVS